MAKALAKSLVSQASAPGDDHPAERVLLLLLGITMPFPAIGVHIYEKYTMPMVAVVAMVWALIRTAREGFGRGHAWAATLLLVFAATSAFRYPLQTYALSLGALALAILPLTVRPRNVVQVGGLLLGVKVGLILTLALMSLQIFLQLLPGTLPLQDMLGEHLTRPQGDFLGYNRPAAGFDEPSYLAIYLSACFALQDLLPASPVRRAWWKAAIASAIVLSGSLSGVAILFMYLATSSAVAVAKGRIRAPRPLTLVSLGLGLVLASIVAVALQGKLSEAVQVYYERLLVAQMDIATDNLMSSEGSRLLAFLALLDFWDSSGILGFLFGTGYANYREVLLQMYGYLHEATSFGRGDVDNMLVVVMLSTGLLGLVAFLAFVIHQLSSIPLSNRIPQISLFFAICFAYGFLIAPMYWNLILVISCASIVGKPSKLT